jgi:hypothetical protein|tara:strand:- start:262 stop:492 length:231 start_codon:yes stop_codon:yes gene_type:complete
MKIIKGFTTREVKIHLTTADLIGYLEADGVDTTNFVVSVGHLDRAPVDGLPAEHRAKDATMVRINMVLHERENDEV